MVDANDTSFLEPVCKVLGIGRNIDARETAVCIQLMRNQGDCKSLILSDDRANGRSPAGSARKGETRKTSITASEHPAPTAVVKDCADQLPSVRTEGCGIQITNSLEIGGRNRTQDGVAQRRECWNLRRHALVLPDAVVLAKSTPLVEGKSGLGRHELQYTWRGIAHHNIHQLPPDPLPLMSLVDQNQSNRSELLAVCPPRGRAQHLAIVIASDPTSSQAEVKLPILQAVRPAFRLAEAQCAAEIPFLQAPKCQSSHQK